MYIEKNYNYFEMIFLQGGKERNTLQLQIDQHGREIKNHGTYEFPVLVSHEALSSYDRRTFLWHWHTEMEWTYILEGEICYQVNEHIFHLKKGQGLLCSTNVLHMGKAENEEDCRYVSITVHPRLFQGFQNSFLTRQYMDPVTDNNAFSHVLFDGSEVWQTVILDRLKQIELLYGKRSEHFEFQIYLLLMENWLSIWQNAWNQQMLQEENTTESRNMQRLKIIFNYIHEHYAEKITLQDVAAQVNICEAECCRLFKKYMRSSLFDYLLDYRIERSTAVLVNSTVTEASESCGFSSPAYYTKVFKARMGCTPKAYKNTYKKG